MQAGLTLRHGGPGDILDMRPYCTAVQRSRTGRTPGKVGQRQRGRNGRRTFSPPFLRRCMEHWQRRRDGGGTWAGRRSASGRTFQEPEPASTADSGSSRPGNDPHRAAYPGSQRQRQAETVRRPVDDLRQAAASTAMQCGQRTAAEHTAPAQHTRREAPCITRHHAPRAAPQDAIPVGNRLYYACVGTAPTRATLCGCGEPSFPLVFLNFLRVSFTLFEMLICVPSCARELMKKKITTNQKELTFVV